MVANKVCFAYFEITVIYLYDFFSVSCVLKLSRGRVFLAVSRSIINHRGFRPLQVVVCRTTPEAESLQEAAQPECVTVTRDLAPQINSVA